MDDESNQTARGEFARRLREFRVLRGFRTARSFAQALSIDENRYTRYERAEVEPSLSLIQRICQLLDIGPNELLGGGAANTGPRLATNGGMAEREAASYSHPRAELPAANGARAQQADALRWLIAREIVSLSGDANGDELQRISRTFAKLDRPFVGIAELLAELEIARSGAGADTIRLRQLVEQLAQLWSDERDGGAGKPR